MLYKTQQRQLALKLVIGEKCLTQGGIKSGSYQGTVQLYSTMVQYCTIFHTTTNTGRAKTVFGFPSIGFQNGLEPVTREEDGIILGDRNKKNEIGDGTNMKTG